MVVISEKNGSVLEIREREEKILEKGNKRKRYILTERTRQVTEVKE